MKRYKITYSIIILSICIVSIISLQTSGESAGGKSPWDYRKAVDGYIITQNKDTLHGKIRMYDEEKSMHAVDFNGKMMSPYNIRQYGFLNFVFDRVYFSDFNDSLFAYREHELGPRIRINLVYEAGIHLPIPHEIMLVDGKEFIFNSVFAYLFSLDKNEKNWFDGYIVDNNSDTTFGKIEFKGILRNQSSVAFKKDSDETEYQPNQLKAYMFNNILLTRKFETSGKTYFAYHIQSGPLNMIAHFKFSPDVTGILGMATGMAASSVTGFGFASLPQPHKYPDVILEKDGREESLNFNKITGNHDKKIQNLVSFYPEYFRNMSFYELERFVYLYDLIGN